MFGLLADLRYGVRMLRKAPVSSLVAILSLGFAIATNTTVFSVASAFLFETFRWKAPEDVVFVMETSREDGRIAVRSELKLLDGFFRFATTAVAKAVGDRTINVTLRTATVGIRGTDFWSMTDEEHDAACIFQGRIDKTLFLANLSEHTAVPGRSQVATA